MSDWQPIETAAKDGRYIKYLAANGERIQPLAWGYSVNAQKKAWCGLAAGIVLPHDPQPTHWHPDPEESLPPPPQGEQE